MTRAYVGIGSNIDPETNIRAAIRMLARRTRVLALSTFYRTESVPPGAPAFINGVAALESAIGPRALKFEVLRDLEGRLGRTRTGDKNAPRTIDCDLLLFGDKVVCEPDLVLPAPEIYERAFVALPLLEIAPQLTLPGSGTRLADVVARLPIHPMSPLRELTMFLRAQLEEGRRWTSHG